MQSLIISPNSDRKRAPALEQSIFLKFLAERSRTVVTQHGSYTNALKKNKSPNSWAHTLKNTPLAREEDGMIIPHGEDPCPSLGRRNCSRHRSTHESLRRLVLHSFNKEFWPDLHKEIKGRMTVTDDNVISWVPWRLCTQECLSFTTCSGI